MSETALTSREGQAICVDIFGTIFASRPDLHADLVEIVEVSARLLLSLLLIKGPIDRDDAELRAFLRRRLLPAVGLGQPADRRRS